MTRPIHEVGFDQNHAIEDDGERAMSNNKIKHPHMTHLSFLQHICIGYVAEAKELAKVQAQHSTQRRSGTRVRAVAATTSAKVTASGPTPSSYGTRKEVRGQIQKIKDAGNNAAMVRNGARKRLMGQYNTQFPQVSEHTKVHCYQILAESVTKPDAKFRCQYCPEFEVTKSGNGKIPRYHCEECKIIFCPDCLIFCHNRDFMSKYVNDEEFKVIYQKQIVLQGKETDSAIRTIVFANND